MQIRERGPLMRFPGENNFSFARERLILDPDGTQVLDTVTGKTYEAAPSLLDLFEDSEGIAASRGNDG